MALTWAQRPTAWRHPKAVGEVLRDQKGETMNLPQQAGKESRFPLADDAHREREEECRKIRRLQMMISMVMSVIGQDPSLTVRKLQNSRPTPNARLWPCSQTRNLPTIFCTSRGCSD